jgi:hypothetical protein
MVENNEKKCAVCGSDVICSSDGTHVICSNDDCETGVDSPSHQALVDDVASIITHQGHKVRKHVPVPNGRKCECGHVQPEHENNSAKCRYCDCEGYAPKQLVEAAQHE